MGGFGTAAVVPGSTILAISMWALAKEAEEGQEDRYADICAECCA